MLLIFGTVVAVLFVVGAINSRAIRQLYRAAKAQIGKIGGFVEAADPLASYQLRIDEFSEAIRSGKESLEKYCGLIRDKQSRLEYLYSDKSKLESRINLILKNKPQNEAIPYASKLANVETEIEKVEDEVVRYTTTYEGFKQKLTQDQEMVNDLREEAKRLGYELNQSKAEAELAGYMPQQLDSGLLEQDRNRIQAAINANRGKVDVALDFAVDNSLDNELNRLESNEKAQAVLSRFVNPPALTDQTESNILDATVVFSKNKEV